MNGTHRIVITRKCIVDIKDNVITKVYPENISVSSFVESNNNYDKILDKFKTNIIDAFKRYEAQNIITYE